MHEMVGIQGDFVAFDSSQDRPAVLIYQPFSPDYRPAPVPVDQEFGRQIEPYRPQLGHHLVLSAHRFFYGFGELLNETDFFVRESSLFGFGGKILSQIRTL
jgi:hypothetical protein